MPPPPPPAVLQISSITSTMPTTRPSGSCTGRCRYLWSCISRNASSIVMSGTTVSGLGVMIAHTRVSSGDRPLDTHLLSTSFGVKMPTNAPAPFVSVTSTPLRCLHMSSAASRTVAVGVTDSRISLPITVRSVGTAPPNICSIKACIATSCALLPPCMATAAVITFASGSTVCEPSSCTLSNTWIASYRHRAMSNRPTTTSSLSSTGK